MLRLITLISFFLLSLTTTLSTANAPFITLQSTTSTQNSGLYDALLKKFTAETGIKVHVVAVGTGQALKNARNGDGDVLLVHAKSAEEKFVNQGYGLKRYDVMYNDFVLVGPQGNPANINHNDTILSALTKIKKSQSLFASRGDDSGTHKKELSLWDKAEIKPQQYSGQWYRETGSGMGATLNTAVAMNAYTLTDRGTWISFKNKHDFVVWVQQDQHLFNQYGVIIVNPQIHPHTKYRLAQTFVDWLLSERGQKSIADYQLNGQQLFFPNTRDRTRIVDEKNSE